MVMLAPRIHRPCAVGAISTGAPASTPTASPGFTPAAARPPAILRAMSWTSAHVCRTGASGSPVTNPCTLERALSYIVSVKRLTVAPFSPFLRWYGPESEIALFRYAARRAGLGGHFADIRHDCGKRRGRGGTIPAF